MKEPRDPRSTWRKRARKVLQKAGRDEWCEDCGRSPVRTDAPGGYFTGLATLEVNHINKNLADIDPANLEYLCASCHKEKDSQTAKGVSVLENEHGYSFDLLGG